MEQDEKFMLPFGSHKTQNVKGIHNIIIIIQVTWSANKPVIIDVQALGKHLEHHVKATFWGITVFFNINEIQFSREIVVKLQLKDNI